MGAQTVLISGAGIAGPTLAFWLAAAGFQTTIVERAPALRTGGYVVDFWVVGDNGEKLAGDHSLACRRPLHHHPTQLPVPFAVRQGR